MNRIQTLCLDKEDLEDLVIIVEQTFSISFKNDDLNSVTTYGDLCQLIFNKIELQNLNDSVSLQCFQNLKKAIVSITSIDESSIKPNVPLEQIFPKTKRRRQIKRLKNSLGFEFNLLTPKGFIVISLLALMLTSFILMFPFRTIGFIGLISSFGGLLIASRLGNEFNVNTISDLSEKIAAEHYTNARRWRNSFNKTELEKQIENLITNHLGVEKKQFRKQSSLL
jgi:hypothetical protein